MYVCHTDQYVDRFDILYIVGSAGMQHYKVAVSAHCAKSVHVPI